MQNMFLKGFVLLLLLTTHSIANSQSKLSYISSGNAINKGIGAHDRGSYKSALKYYNKVHEGDTNYVIAQYEICNTYFAMEEYQKAIDVAEIALQAPNPSASEFYNLLGSAYDELGNREKAIEVYTVAIKEFPMFYRTYYNRAVTYQRMEDFNAAILDYQSALRLNPYHATSHFKLGELALAEGELAKAMLCFNSYLLMEPGNNTDFLAKFNSMADGDFEEDANNAEISTDDYQTIDELLLSKIALKSSYKTPNKLHLPLVKQNYLLFTELAKRDLGTGFFDSFYAPFYIKLMEMNKFNDFMYYSIQSSTNDGIVKVLEKNIKKINEFPDWAGDLWQAQHSTGIKDIDGEQKEITFSWLDGSSIEGWSTVIDGVSQGYSEYYHYNGRLNATGNFDKNGKQTGKWLYYSNTGALAGIEYYQDGKIEGADTAFWPNGLVKTSDNYVAGITEGLSYSYFESGAAESEMNYKNSEPHGTATYFTSLGVPNYVVEYKEGVLDGEFIEYYPNQQIAEKAQFEEDSRTGLAYEYFMNGNKKAETNYKEGQGNGKYTTWYPNGTIKEDGEYKNGAIIGKFTEYYPNGSISYVANYDESGKENGTYKEYDLSGKLNVELTYRKGEMIAYKIYNRNGDLIKESKKNNKEFLFENFYSDGTRRTTGIYQPNDLGKNGIWKFYDKNGVLESEEHYSNGMLNGRSTNYFTNGKKSEAVNFIDGKEDGYYVDYFTNSKMQTQGYYVAGLQEGVWHSYQEDGVLQAENFYVNGKMNGPQTYYNVDGSLDLIETYDMDQLIQFELFDTAGVSYQKEITSPDSSMYTIKSFSGATLREFSRKYYISHGPSTNYHGNGQVSKTGEYFFGKQNGVWQYFHENGELKEEGEYFFEEKLGTWKKYNDRKILISQETYSFGNLHGDALGYQENGNLDYKIPYEHGLANGTASYYDGNGVLQFYREYFYDKVIGYSYNGKDGKPVEMIPITNETGKLKSYFPNGNVSREYEMLNGKFIGNYSEYYENGQLMASTNYENGMVVGERNEYWDNGNLMLTENYIDNYKNGVFKYFDKNGKLTKTETYLVDELNGPTKHYNSAEKVIKTVNYFDGILITDKK